MTGSVFQCDENRQWKSIDEGQSSIFLYHDESKDTYRVIAKAANNQFVLNSWIKKESKLSKLSDKFVGIRTTNIDYGFSFTSPEVADTWYSNLENTINLLKNDSNSSYNASPSPIVSSPSPINIVSQQDEDFLRGRSNSSDIGKGVTSSNSSGSIGGVGTPPKLVKSNSMSAKDLAKHANSSIRLKKKDNSSRSLDKFATLSLGTRVSLATIATNFQEAATQVILDANECVLNNSITSNTIKVSKVLEMIQMILILSNKPNLPPLITKLLDNLMNQLSSFADKGNLEQHTVEAASGLALKLVKASLIKKIHNQLIGVQNMALQLQCIVTYISNVDSEFLAMVQLAGTIKGFLIALNKLNDAVTTLKHIESMSSTRRNSTLQVFVDEAGNLWDEPLDILEVTGNSKDDIKLGSFNQLVTKLTSDTSYDNKFLKTFITTYQSFTEPWTLLEKLKQRYQVPDTIEKGKCLAIQLRVSIVLKHWVENQLDDFDEDLILNLRDFIRSLSNQEGLKKVADTLHNYLLDQIDKRVARTILWFQPPEKVEIPEEGLCLSDLFMELPTVQIAEQLTLIDFEIFKNIEPTELLNQSWNKNSLKHRSPNILAMINRSTRLSHWVALMILSQDDLTVRAKMFEKMIDIANHLLKLNNFNTLMGVIAGLNMSSVHRLKATIKKVEKSKLDIWKKLEKTMDPEGSFANYRKQIAAAGAPSLPYLGVHLTDYVFIEDGNPGTINNMINWKKRDLLIETIMKLQQYQTTSYNIEVVEPIYTFLREFPFLDDAVMYDISTTLEPKTSKDKDKKDKKSKQ